MCTAALFISLLLLLCALKQNLQDEWGFPFFVVYPVYILMSFLTFLCRSPPHLGSVGSRSSYKVFSLKAEMKLNYLVWLYSVALALTVTFLMQCYDLPNLVMYYKCWTAVCFGHKLNNYDEFITKSLGFKVCHYSWGYANMLNLRKTETTIKQTFIFDWDRKHSLYKCFVFRLWRVI